MKRSRLTLVLGGFAVGMVAGAALGVCLAPDRGEAIRQRLAAESVKASRRGMDAMQAALREPEKAMVEGRNRWRPSLGAARSWLRSRVAFQQRAA